MVTSILLFVKNLVTFCIFLCVNPFIDDYFIIAIIVLAIMNSVKQTSHVISCYYNI